MHSPCCKVMLVLAAATCVAGYTTTKDGDLWGAAVEACGKAARDSDANRGAECHEQYQRRFEGKEGTDGYAACDAEYCECAGGNWVGGVCAETPNECKLSCSCMEMCYAKQMRCTFEHTLTLFTTHHLDDDVCQLSGMTSCFRDTNPAFIAECKRGISLPISTISWMSQPIPQGCDADKVCGGASTPAASLFLVVGAALAVAHVLF